VVAAIFNAMIVTGMVQARLLFSTAATAFGPDINRSWSLCIPGFARLGCNTRFGLLGVLACTLGANLLISVRRGRIHRSLVAVAVLIGAGVRARVSKFFARLSIRFYLCSGWS